MKIGILRLTLILGCSLTLLSACEEEKAPSPDMTAGRPLMRILFIGNEYTSNHNMPAIVQALAQNDPSAHFKIEVGLYVAPGSTLPQISDNEETKFLLMSTKWDYVVLQPHNLWAANKNRVSITGKAVHDLSDQIKALNSQPILFLTWPLDQKSTHYKTPRYANLKNHNNMHKMTRGYSKSVAKKYGLQIAPVGDYWMYSIDKNPEIYLYNLDGSTPTIEGSYLTALIIYKNLVDTTLDDIEYAPKGIRPEIKAKLTAIASQKLLD